MENMLVRNQHKTQPHQDTLLTLKIINIGIEVLKLPIANEYYNGINIYQ